MNRVLVACGTGAATAAVIAQALVRALRERGLEVEVTLASVADVPQLAPGHDLIVSTTPITASGGVPVIHTLAFLTGVGSAAAVDRIVTVLQDGAARAAASRGGLNV